MSNGHGSKVSAEFIANDSFPITYQPVLFTTLQHLDRFDAMLPRWQELRRTGVRFAADFPFAATQRGWAARRKSPLPFLGSAVVTLTQDSLSLHAHPVKLQKQIETSAMRFIERSVSTEYSNLDTTLSRSIDWPSVVSVKWHIAKPHDGIGSMPPSSHYVMVMTSAEHDNNILLQVAPPFTDKPVELQASKSAERAESRKQTAIDQTHELLELLQYLQQTYGETHAEPDTERTAHKSETIQDAPLSEEG